MSLMRLTVRDGAAEQDVEITVEPNSTIASLIESLPFAVGGRACYVGQQPLNPHATVAQSPLVPGAIITLGRPGPLTRTATGDGVGRLRVISGPDAGTTVSLGPGRHRIARDAAAEISLRDPDVSRREHAWLEVTPDGRALVTDPGSTNGTFVDGVQVGGAALLPGATMRVGHDELQWEPAPVGVLRTVRAPDGRLDFDRAYAAVPEVPSLELAMPSQRQAPRSQITAAVTAGLTVVASVTLAIILKTWTILIFSGVGAVAFVVAWAVERNQRGQREREYGAARAALEAQLQSHLAAEWNARSVLAPGPAEITAIITGARPDLWARRVDTPSGLVLRVGVADQPAAVTVRGEPWPGYLPPMLQGVPASVDLRTTGVLGVVGSDRDVHDVLRWLLIQLAATRGPDDLRLVVMAAADRPDLAWTRWLPHLDAGESAAVPCRVGNTDRTRAARIDELRTVLAARLAARSPSGSRVEDEIVLVLDGALTLRELPGMDAILRDGPAVGIYVICADRRGMNECRGICEIGPGGLSLTRGRDERPILVAADRLDEDSAQRLARTLSPMRDRITFARAQHAMPAKVRLLDLLGIGLPGPDDVLEQWAGADAPRTRVLLGADATGAAYIDLARQGPHTMLGGATGAGKSILMQTLVTALLLANQPDAMNLVLVDFKGGSAFLPFENCPHVVALIRSTGETAADVFDAAAAARVLASVRAEVNRRESVLARYNGEIDDYWRRRRSEPELPPLPRLVMIFDEFARVLETSPDFLKELVNVAAKGRSLGMHLLLGTQSLQGKLSAELKNNISLRISLRQNEPAESVEVLGVPDAAEIPGTLRGRGLIVCTTDESRLPLAFQSGYLGDPPPTGVSAVPALVRPVAWASLGEPRPVQSVPRPEGPTDQELVIAAIEQAARHVALPAPFRPLLPPLPARVELDQLTALATTRPPRTAVPFGLADEPSAQAQPLEYLDLFGVDRLMVAGGPQSGRTTFARTLITSLATRFGPDEAHLYLIEQYRGGLAEYADLPHCGGAFSPSEPDRIRRFVGWLEQEVQRRAIGADPAGSPARIVVIVDGWEYFEDHSNPTFTESSILTRLREIIATGAPLGVHVVALGGHDMLSHKLPTYYSRRLLLQFPKEDTRRAHLTSKMTTPAALPGRAIDAGSGRHIQLCETLLPAAELIAKARLDAPPALLPRRFPSLPPRVGRAELPAPGAPTSPTWIPFGVGGPDTATVGLDLFGGPHTVLISGPPGSGRTSAAATVARGLRQVGVNVLVLAPPNSPLPSLLPQEPGVRVVAGLSIEDAALREAVAGFGDGPFAVVVDDATQVTVVAAKQGFGEAPTLLDECAQPAARGRSALVLTGDAAPILAGFPSPLSRLMNTAVNTGVCVLLTPANRPAAMAHRMSLEPDQFISGPPGRGYVSSAPGPQLVQVAAP